jgi:porin
MDLMKHRTSPLWVATTLLLAFALAAGASDEPAGVTATTDGDAEQVASSHEVPGFGGPSAVGHQLQADDKKKESPALFKGLTRSMQPYYDFKDRLKKKHGLALGADYNMLYQTVSESSGEDHAASGIIRLFGTWTLVGRKSGNTGSLVAKIENRHLLGTDIPPQALASEVGYAGLTAIIWSDAGSLLTNLYWHQSFNEDRVSFVAGIVDATDYLDIYGLINPWTNFANLSFSTDPTIPVPNQGLGAALRVNIADHYYVLAGLADTNGDPGDTSGSFDTFFDDREYFKHIEFGRVGSREAEFTDNFHIFAWQADERIAAQVPKGWGATISFSKQVTKHWMPFARVGYSDGGGGVFLEQSLSAGVGYFLSARSDLLAFGAAWGRPSEMTYGPGLDDQYTLEMFYRLQIFQHWTVNGDLQLLIDPALDPTRDKVWVFGLSARINF